MNRKLRKLWNLSSSKWQEYEVAVVGSIRKKGENLCDTLWEAVKSILEYLTSWGSLTAAPFFF